MRKVIIVAGPTASGKTKYSIDLAKKLNGVIINCDSLQVYDDLKILTAFPTTEELSAVPHKLFGFLDFFEKITAASWAEKAAIEIEECIANNLTPIIAGGTGLYINTLIQGLSPIPEIPKKTREKVSKLATDNYEEVCKKVYSFDPKIKDIITIDKHRQMLRAYEVFLETGKSILEFYELPRKFFLQDVTYEFHIMNAEKPELYKKINDRFINMLDNGAIEEVKKLLDITDINDRYELYKDYPIFNAIGAKEIVAYLDGIYELEDVVEQACLNSRHYAKRQITWFKHQIPFDVKTLLI